ncbi:hypothetical protein B7494_g3740 [Chlorociboria aeruginascens]|nr:hypothetical protein B7494_g3740 [Chlorociboria aeruginascens]
MMLRGRSKDRNRKVTPPGPSYMSNEQFADYLADLRNNRVARPSGARPQPSNIRREPDRGVATTAASPIPAPDTPSSTDFPRSASALSHRRGHSSLSNYSSVTSRTSRQVIQSSLIKDVSQEAILSPSEVVPSATYIERGQRWMEKEEAVSLREAMEDMDLKKQVEEAMRIQAAAQDEASELVWLHQNPEAIRSGAPYSYKEHLRKNSYAHARTQSVGRHRGMGTVTGLARDIAPRSASGSSSSSGGIRSRVSSGHSDHSQLDRSRSPDPQRGASLDSSRPPIPKMNQKPYGSISNSSRSLGLSRRISSGKRNISGEIARTFTGEQIWEEPEQETSNRGRPTDHRDIPAPLKLKPRNPLNRVQFAQDVQPRSNSTPPPETKKLSRYEIHQNPPSQSKNPSYTFNPLRPLPKAQTTLMPESESADGLEIRSEEIRQATSMRLKDRSPKLPTPTIVSDKPGAPHSRRRSQYEPPSTKGQTQVLPTSSSAKGFPAPIPTIQLPDTPTIEVNNIPSISVPSISISDSTPSVPTINFPEAPRILVSDPTPTVNVPPSQKARPLPDPRFIGRSNQRYQSAAAVPRGHWSPAAGRRATATCHQCSLPIEGRVLVLPGTSERFHPECFICFTCGTALESLEIHLEPPSKRTERIDRINRRDRGEQLPEIEGQTMAEDGDSRVRYYCHLDWHEQFAPKCKHCKTPIIGEAMVAVGEHWHYGHFFCAECGDPFEKGSSHIEKDGYAWCLSCQTKRTERQAPKCKKCKCPVIGQYVVAMGGEWHEECFRCGDCNGGFDDGQIFPKEVNGQTIVFCTGCRQKQLKA